MPSPQSQGQNPLSHTVALQLGEHIAPKICQFGGSLLGDLTGEQINDMAPNGQHLGGIEQALEPSMGPSMGQEGTKHGTEHGARICVLA